MVGGSQPAGTVSLLFSDVAGSTGLLQRLGAERYAASLARQRELLRAAFVGERAFVTEVQPG